MVRRVWTRSPFPISIFGPKGGKSRAGSPERKIEDTFLPERWHPVEWCDGDAEVEGSGGEEEEEEDDGHGKADNHKQRSLTPTEHLEFLQNNFSLSSSTKLCELILYAMH